MRSSVSDEQIPIYFYWTLVESIVTFRIIDKQWWKPDTDCLLVIKKKYFVQIVRTPKSINYLKRRLLKKKIVLDLNDLISLIDSNVILLLLYKLYLITTTLKSTKSAKLAIKGQQFRFRFLDKQKPVLVLAPFLSFQFSNYRQKESEVGLSDSSLR